MDKREFLYLGWYLLLCVPIIMAYTRYSLRAKKEWLSLTGRIRPDRSPGKEMRKYIRLESTFPVEFQRIEETGREKNDIYQGFARDISREGMSIEAMMLHGKAIDKLLANKTRLRLFINIPSDPHPTITDSTVRWVRKSEDADIDRYLIGVSYDDMKEPDLTRLTKYALWFRRKPEVFTFVVVAAAVLMIALVSAVLIFRGATSTLEKRIEALDREKAGLTKEAEEIVREKEELRRDLEAMSSRYTAIWKGLKRKKDTEAVKEEALPETIETSEIPPEKIPPAEEEAEPAEEEPAAIEKEELLEEPVVMLREAVLDDDEIVVEPNITRKMIESEKGIYKTFRDYILREETQLLDRYCSQHKTSIYHAAGLFALAELRYKNGHIKEMTIKAYRDVIKLYPRSKYASYASHRLEQLEKNLIYGAFNLKYYYAEYSLPPLFDYRELEPYKE